MKKISDFNSATEKYPVVYAGSATRPEYVDMPTILQQQEGVAPLDTCPAQWWNAMWKLATKDINAFRDYVGDAFTEINNLLTKFGITLDDADSEQLYDFFHDDYVQNYLTTVLSSVFVNKSGDTIDGDLHVKGDLTVDGIGEEVISTELKVGANTITLRNGNPSSLGNTELAGVVTENYDGNNNNNIIAIDKNGVARTGDIDIATRVLYSSDGTNFFTDEELTEPATIGATEQVRDTGNQTSGGVEIYEGITYSNDDTQALATRDDNLTDGQLVKWDGTTKKLVSTNDYATKSALHDEWDRATNAEILIDATKNVKIQVNDSSATITDSTAFLEGNAGTNPDSFLRHTFSKVWDYISSKISSVLGLTASSYGGNAASATNATNATNAGNADTVDGYHASENADGSTVGARTANGYFNAVIFHDSFGEENINAYSNPKIMFKGDGDGFIRNTDPSNISVGYATSAGSATSASSASNSGALEGKSWRETALSGLYVTDNTSSLSGASYTFSPSAPVGSAELAVGSTVKVTFANPLQSSTAITSVNFNYGGRNGQIVAARQNTLVGLASHVFQGGEYSAQYPNKVWDAYTTLELMWTGSYWLVMGDAVLCSYFSSDANYTVKANGFITQWGLRLNSPEGTTQIYFPVIYSSIPSVNATLYGWANNTACVMDWSVNKVGIDFAYGNSPPKGGSWTAIGY